MFMLNEITYNVSSKWNSKKPTFLSFWFPKTKQIYTFRQARTSYLCIMEISSLLAQVCRKGLDYLKFWTNTILIKQEWMGCNSSSSFSQKSTKHV